MNDEALKAVWEACRGSHMFHWNEMHADDKKKVADAVAKCIMAAPAVAGRPHHSTWRTIRHKSEAVAGRTQGDLENEIKELQGWKQSAISVMPDYQAIGAELNVRWGDSVHDKILHGIKALKAELAALRESAREAPSKEENG